MTLMYKRSRLKAVHGSSREILVSRTFGKVCARVLRSPRVDSLQKYALDTQCGGLPSRCPEFVC